MFVNHDGLQHYHHTPAGGGVNLCLEGQPLLQEQGRRFRIQKRQSPVFGAWQQTSPWLLVSRWCRGAAAGWMPWAFKIKVSVTHSQAVWEVVKERQHSQEQSGCDPSNFDSYAEKATSYKQNVNSRINDSLFESFNGSRNGNPATLPALIKNATQV